VTDYILTALRFSQILERNDQGRPTKEIKHRTGALITGLDELEAERLLAAGAIVSVDDVAPSDGNSVVEGVGSGEPAPASGTDANSTPSDPPADPLRRPRPTATQEKWAAYAKARGIDAEKVDAMTSKDDIIAAVDELDAQ